MINEALETLVNLIAMAPEAPICIGPFNCTRNELLKIVLEAQAWRISQRE